LNIKILSGAVKVTKNGKTAPILIISAVETIKVKNNKATNYFFSSFRDMVKKN
jgi:hypothetical protein